MTGLKGTMLAGAVFACIGLIGIAVLVQAQAPSGQAPAAQTQAPAGMGAAPVPPKPIAEEYLLLGDETRGSGEAELAVDPTNPNNMVAIGMGTWQMIPGCEPPNVNCKDFHNYPNSTHPVSAVTNDGGRTWRHFILPIIDESTAYDKRTRCPDSFAYATKDGTFLVGCEPRETSETVVDPPGGTALLVSTDKGKTWSKRVEGISDYTGPNFPAFAPGLKPRHGGNAPWDRPWITFDDQTGTIYLISTGGQTDIDTGKPGVYRTQSYFTVSHNNGNSFGTIYALDTLDWPQASRADIAAGHGTLAVTYVASKVPASENAKCPCQVFGISTDEGKTFTRHVMKHVVITPAPTAPGGRVSFGDGDGALTSPDRNLRQDPTAAGRFTIMRYMKIPNPHYELSTSNDSGKTWSQFVSIGTVPGATSFIKHELKYSRWGVLGVVWKAVYKDGSYELWSAISRDGGRTFSDPLRVSSAPSPARNYYRESRNDDTCGLDLSKDDFYTIWGDARSGYQASWFGKVSLSSYKFSGK